MSAETMARPCGCCDPEPEEARIENRSGLPEIHTRIATHSDFLRRLLERLPTYAVESGARPLAALTTRADDDPTIALLDAWSVVADVLTFYQERIANEGYLRTATERRSVLELARAIGYELAPGVAASTVLTFTVDDAPGAPTSSVVPAGTRVLSIPAQGQLPQPFETSREIVARREWNALRPRLTQPQTLEIDGGTLYLVALDGTRTEAGRVYLDGSHTTIRRGDRILVALDQGGSVATLTPRVHAVEYEPERNRTRVDLVATPNVPAFAPVALPLALPFLQKVSFSMASVAEHVLGRSWRDRDLKTFLAVQRWSTRDLVRHVEAPPPPPAPLQTGVFALRERVGIFGHNAQDFDSLPATAITKGDPYPHDWDSGGFSIWRDPKSSSSTPAHWADADLFLERKVDGVLPGSWAVLERPGTAETYQVLAARELSVTGFGLSAKSTGLELAKPDGTSIGSADKSDSFLVRGTTVHIGSEALPLAELPIEDDLAVGDDSLMLGGLVLDLEVGQPVVLSGERADAAGVVATEVHTLAEIIHQGGFTTLHFERGLEHTYRRGTVTINANAVEATHGETVTEVLGSGDGAVANPAYELRKPPLTYISAATPSGRETTLEVRVGGVRWEPADSLLDLGPRDRGYVVRIEDDGTTRVVFGDGVHGARVPTGAENVRAAYRSGIGGAGEVDAGSLTLLQARPLGIRGVTNPLPATGSEDPEALDEARENAPLGVLTFERIVSLRDYENFARAFAGIGKASAVALWNGEDRLVHLTVASASGETVDESSSLYTNLVDAIDGARDPVEAVVVQGFQPLHFNLSARVRVDPALLFADVAAQVERALLDAFSFDTRAFGQDVTAAELVAAIHGVDGVVAVDLDALYLATDEENGGTATLATRLPSEPTRWGDSGVLPGQLLLLNPAGIDLQELTS